MKYLKLFENFINEELSPELKKRAYDAMMKIANDPNAIDNLKRNQQAQNVLESVTPAVKTLLEELKGHAKKVFPDLTKPMEVNIYDFGLRSSGCVVLEVAIDNYVIIDLSISKDKYEKGKKNSDAARRLLSDRAFIKTMKKLIVQIQKDEIPGDDPVPAEPSPLTKEGELVLFPLVPGNEPQEDDISKYGTGGSGLPPHTTEAGQIARGR